ncbi:unnamed protein product [Enterobius vermicularis]|uniref:Beta-lactamase n=1 Tax=Enterobius vermicularis TaxID=51028 RepID=A0A0N4V4L2_ENTVE|nr:unnamed protein product [Enterobius vermicularis]
MLTEAQRKANLEAEEYLKNLELEFSFGCIKENRADSCHQHAVFLEQMRRNAAEAFKFFKTNCEKRKYPESCLKYAKYLIVGYFPKIYFLLECEPSIEGAIKPLKIACEGNVASACHLLSLVYYNTKGVKAASDVEKYMRRACDLEDGKSCWILSTWYLGAVSGTEVVDGKKQFSCAQHSCNWLRLTLVQAKYFFLCPCF